MFITHINHMMLCQTKRYLATYTFFLHDTWINAIIRIKHFQLKKIFALMLNSCGKWSKVKCYNCSQHEVVIFEMVVVIWIWHSTTRVKHLIIYKQYMNFSYHLTGCPLNFLLCLTLKYYKKYGFPKVFIAYNPSCNILKDCIL